MCGAHHIIGERCSPSPGKWLHNQRSSSQTLAQRCSKFGTCVRLEVQHGPLLTPRGAVQEENVRLRQQLVSAKEAPAVRPEHADAAVLQVLEAREARVAELEEALAVLQSNTQELAAELAEEMAGAVVEKSAEQLMAMTQDLEVAADENAKLRQLLSMQKVSQPSDQTLDLDSQVACNGLQSIINSSVPATGRLRRQSTQSRLIGSRSHALVR